MLFDGCRVAGFPCLFLLFDQGRYLRGQTFVGFGKLLDERVLRRELQAGGAADGVQARGVNRDARRVRRNGIPSHKPSWRPERNLAAVAHAFGFVSSRIEHKINRRAFAAPDPVALHGADLLRPAG